MSITKSCATCGTPSSHTYCPDHRPRDQRANHRRDTTTASWRRLAALAKHAQPFCQLCGTTTNLQVDHSPRAWARIALRLPVNLCDVSVLCGPCNSRAGSSKPGSPRYQQWQQTDGNPRNRTPGDNTLGERGTPTPPHPSGKAKFPSHTPGGIR